MSDSPAAMGAPGAIGGREEPPQERAPYHLRLDFRPPAWETGTPGVLSHPSVVLCFVVAAAGHTRCPEDFRHSAFVL